MSIFYNSKKKKEQELKEMIFDKYFKSKQHKKIIVEAAQKSSKDQKALSKRYYKMIANNS